MVDNDGAGAWRMADVNWKTGGKKMQKLFKDHEQEFVKTKLLWGTRYFTFNSKPFKIYTYSGFSRKWSWCSTSCLVPNKIITLLMQFRAVDYLEQTCRTVNKLFQAVLINSSNYYVTLHSSILFFGFLPLNSDSPCRSMHNSALFKIHSKEDNVVWMNTLSCKQMRVLILIFH